MKVREIKRQAYKNFKSGLHCAEVVSKTILNSYCEEPHPDAIKASSYFGGGIAGTMEELCGAFTGGVIVLGILLGRESPEEAIKEGTEIVKQYKIQFLEQFGSVNCQTLIKGFAAKEDRIGCVKLTANAAALLATLLEEFEQKNEIDMNSFNCQPRGYVALSPCPFNSCLR